ncbi:hypothetical protein V6N13_016457 [Hibiscus sabdariffa]
MKNHPELKEIIESDRDLETEDIADILLQKILLVHSDRVVKTVRPGKKKLSSWPAHLEIFPVSPLFCVTLKIKCLPETNALSSSGFIHILTLFAETMRAAIFGAAWIVLGKRVWFFPNILAEEATLRELFCFWPKKDEEERPKWTARLFYAIFAVLVILLLRHHAPNEAARARYQKRMSNIIDDVLEWSPSLALSGMMEKQTVVNATEDNNKFSNESEVTSADETESSEETDEHQNDTV